MSKERKSKLDAHVERLDEWLGVEKQTFDYVIGQLKQDGVTVSKGRLSEWWSARQSQLLQAQLLDKIATGARQCKDLEAQFADNPAPGMDIIMKLNRSLIMQLATAGQADPELMKLADQMTRTVMEFMSGQTKADLKKQSLAIQERRISLDVEKFQFDAAATALKEAAKIKSIAAKPGLGDKEKIKQIRLALFGSAPD